MSRLPLRAPSSPGRLAAPLAAAAAAAVLFLAYLRLSRTVAANSDGASVALQAWAMLHGNLLLHGWVLSDVAFYTTELPQYMLIEAVRGLNPDVTHIAAAMTYTLLVLLAAVLARGRARGRQGLLRALLAAGIMIAPPLGSVYVLMLEPDHVGSVVPVLLLAILLDRAGRRWWVPAAAGLLVAWTLIADQVLLVSAVLPLVAVAALRGYRALFPAGPAARRARPGWPWFETALAGAALAGAAAAEGALRLIRAEGGFLVHPVSRQLAGIGQLPHNALITIQSVLVLFGANFAGHRAGLLPAIGLLHLVGVALVAWAAGSALRRLGRLPASMQLATVSIFVTFAAFLLGPNAFNGQSGREMAVVLPLGAALAGRLLAGRLRRARLVPALAAVLVVYLGGLAFYSTRPAVPAQGQALAGWLAGHGLRSGLTTDYWSGNSATLDSGGRVTIRTIQRSGPHLEDLKPNLWEINHSWYAPRRQRASFVVLTERGTWPHQSGAGALLHSFGRPRRVYRVNGHTVLVWDSNLLAKLARLPKAAAEVTERTGARRAGR